ncbi:MAG: hypothetical protein WC135_02760 [Bacteroidales bacterium]
MAEKKIKAFVTKVHQKAEPGGIEYKWDSLTSRMPSFTKSIITPAISVDKDGRSEVNIGAIVSGMPTVFARANMFINALNTVTDKSANADGLLGFYKSLVDEWRGFIACIAFDYSELTVRRIYLSYSDGKKIIDTNNIYEPKGAFGNVLFERKPLWSDQTSAGNTDNYPFIDVISYKGKVVGGTSPESFLFTSVEYKLDGNSPYINVKNKQFTDPLKSDINNGQLNVLYGYVKFINNKIDSFRKQFDELDDNLKPNYGNINGNLQDWLKEMDAYASKKGFKITEQVPELTIFKKPFSTLFNHSTELYGTEGIISSDIGLEGSIPFDPKNLLLPDGSEIAQIEFVSKEADKNVDFPKTRSIYMLQAKTKGEDSYSYFALPLTALALNVFGKNIGSLVGIENSNVESRLYAEYDPNSDVLEVKLDLFTQANVRISKTQKYKVGKVLKHKDILLWPNFISKKWGKYFMYSELPHNDSQYQATPFVGDMEDEYFRIITDENNKPVYLSENGKIKSIADTKLKDKLRAKLHVVSDNRVSDNKYKYEIYESNIPFKGLKLSYADIDCGYIIIRYSTGPDALIKNKLNDNQELLDANLGIDFGSTNTSVAYYSKSTNKMMSEMIFKNKRVSLFSNDDNNNDVNAAVENEIFFFQNDEIKSNAIKSILTLHDFKRLVKDSVSQSNESLVSQAVKGGFPCFEKNLPIEDANDGRFFLNYANAGRVELVQNMKWSNQEIENSYKTAYLSSLLLHVYAQLFEEGHKPVNLKWSYPSSMSNNLIRQYIQIWTKLSEVNPLNETAKLKIYNPITDLNMAPDAESNWGNAEHSDPWGSTGDSKPENDWGGVTSNPANSWGDLPSAPVASGWGEGKPNNTSTNNLKAIKTELGPIDFDFKVLSPEESLTESCAVANYLANSGQVSTDMRFLTICFDVGGSTTDIMALCNMMGPQGIGLAMVKQNSIRFAAQRVAQATRNSPNFKSVMIEMCERKNITIQGLNKGENKYTSNTAPYYFEQLVDRLDDNDLIHFYQLLAGKCPELMCINLYVTGLIMYYAGQLALKLRTEVINSPNKLPGMENWKPIVNIVFAGKGARIFDWLKSNNSKQSQDYYTSLFIRGFGGMQKAKDCLGGPPNINPTNNDSNGNIKYEVSKGLAQDTEKLFVPKNNVAIELIGEDNFIVLTSNGEQKQIKSEDSITPEMMESIGSYFLSSPSQGNPPCPKFMDFADAYFNIATTMFGLPLSKQDFLEGFNNMNIGSYIRQLPEYRMAQESKQKEGSSEFDFVAPIIILEGMKFLEDVILKKISYKK